MPKSILVALLAILACQPAVAADYRPAISAEYGWRLPPERHVIEIVRPPYSGSFVINHATFIAKTPVCWDWTAGERVTLLAGDWHGQCYDAVFYNVARHRSCAMWCGWGVPLGD
jgi:hypothetical protein